MARQGNGSNAYLMSDYTQGAPFTNYPYTVSFWHYRPSGLATNAIFSYGNNSINQYYMIYNSGATLYVYMFGDQDQSVSGAVSGWNHCVWRGTSTTNRSIFLNGAENNTTVGRAIVDPPNRYGVLNSVQQSPPYPAGANEWCADLGIWDVSLSNEEISLLYNNRMCPLMIRSNSLVTYCPLNDGEGGARDLIGGRNLAESGTAVLTDNPPLLYKRRSFMTFTPGVSLSTYSSIFHGSVF